MSQKTVQFVIGRLLTDEEYRFRFLEEPREVLVELLERGFELTRAEIDALVRTDRRMWIDASSRIDPHLQRCSFRSD